MVHLAVEQVWCLWIGAVKKQGYLPDVDSQGHCESQGDVEQSGDIHYATQG